MTKDELKKEAEEESFRYVLDKPWACYVEKKQIMGHFEKGYIASAEPREKRIAELEKENAELKRNKKTVVHLAECLEEKQEEQLAQAKKIIKGLLSCCRNYPQENAEKMKQAEQFLNDIKE